MSHWFFIITTISTDNATLRQRIWRGLKASGAAVLRDGVYLMPEREDCRVKLEALASEIREGGGTAYVLRVEQAEGAHFTVLFDRSQDFTDLLAEVSLLRQTLNNNTAPDVLRQTRKLRKAFVHLAKIDFFPNYAQQQVDGALRALELACAGALSPGDPVPQAGSIPRLLVSNYQGRTWATRQRPWVDRLASAWLIRRLIDPHARIVWLSHPSDCPEGAIGFDFDGATFTHIGNRVTFEVLVASFGLQQPALARLGLLVHGLDVGGVQPPESVGLESILAGMRESITNDDQLLSAASSVFDAMLLSFNKGTTTS
jgi:hypothetical protein